MSVTAPMGAAISRAGQPAYGSVSIITPAQFQAAVAKGKVIVEFFSYGCPYCQRARGPVADAAKRLANEAQVYAISVDDPAGKALGIRHGLSYYPTFAIFENGRHAGTFARDGGNDVTAEYVVAGVKKIFGQAPRMNGIG